jgi:hypothetical protein
VNSERFIQRSTFRTISSDTRPKMREFQILLLRNSAVARRLAKVRSLSQTTIQLSRRAIARSNPELTDDELKCRTVEYFYGKSLARKFQEYLAEGKK